MKLLHQFSGSSLLSYWRVAMSGTFLSAAVAVAFVAASSSSSNSAASRVSHRVLKKEAEYGVGSRNEGHDGVENPHRAAEEDYAARSYPAAYVPFSFTANAQAAWSKIKSQKINASLSSWTLMGPSIANFPDILTFSGAAFTTSGRITALAIAPTCTPDNCKLWVGAAGGGVWRTNNALSGSGPSWNFVSESFATNAIGTLTYDNATNTLYAGTGEPNASADSEAGFGIYKSTDGGNNWTHLAALTMVPGMATPCGLAPAYSGPAFDGRAISSIVVKGSTIYVGSTRAVRGVSSVSSGGVVSLAPGLPPFGLWKSTDGGATFTLLAPEGVCLNPLLAGDAGKIQSTFGSVRGVNDVEFDPNYATNTTLYAAAFPRLNGNGGGVWRTTDDGANFTQIKTALSPSNTNDRAEFSVTLLGGGTTRMYVGDGNTGFPAARFYRSDDVATGTPVFTDLTAAQVPAGQTFNYCTGQCWYDNVVFSPPGYPDIVYLGGSYDYATYAITTNSRGLLYSTDAGASFTDVSWDATTNPTPPGTCCQPNPVAPNGMHPDHHAVVASPGNPGLFFDGSDGGLMRSSGSFADISSQCTTYRGLSGDHLALCEQLLSRVPTFLYSLNKGLSTLQFQSLSVAADNFKHLQGGTQDNGTFETTGSKVVWPQIIYGDGGQSGFNVGNSAQRFNTFFAQYTDANFQNGDPSKWVVISGPLFAEGSQFYKPIIADPFVAGTIFVGELSVWRTQDWGGDQTFLETNCPEFTTSGSDPSCGDFVKIGNGVPSTLLTDASWGDRSAGNVAAVARSSTDSSTLWAATTTGRVFFASNADAAPASVVWERLDSSSTTDPNRFVSGITVDPANPNHAWISYSSYSSLTPTTLGHVFEVTRTGPSTATWTSIDGTGTNALPDFPVTAIARDTNTGDLYVGNDWGVLRLVAGNPANGWFQAGSGLPMVEVAGLTIVPSARRLYAATHGRSAWLLTLP
ncbi:MAG: exo-alpha-sialidase [Chthoniobacterales bacterium]